MKIKYILGFLITLHILSCGGGGGGNISVPISTPPVTTVGLDIFALMNPNFPVSDVKELLGVSDKPTFGILHKTFGSNVENYYDLTEHLMSLGKEPHVRIHAMCGPCRKPRRDGSLEFFFGNLSINEINNAITNNLGGVRLAYKNLLLEIKDIYILPYPQLTFDVSLDLESNLTQESIIILAEIAKEVYSTTSNVALVHNPLLANELYIPEFKFEIHTNTTNNLPLLRQNDIVSLDGHQFKFPGEFGDGSSFNNTKELIFASLEKNITIYLWRREWQGLTPANEFTSPDPNQRTYRFTQKDKIKELLLIK